MTLPVGRLLDRYQLYSNFRMVVIRPGLTDTSRLHITDASPYLLVERCRLHSRLTSLANLTLRSSLGHIHCAGIPAALESVNSHASRSGDSSGTLPTPRVYWRWRHGRSLPRP